MLVGPPSITQLQAWERDLYAAMSSEHWRTYQGLQITPVGAVRAHTGT
jgi:hypothetical protein